MDEFPHSVSLLLPPHIACVRDMQRSIGRRKHHFISLFSSVVLCGGRLPLL